MVRRRSRLSTVPAALSPSIALLAAAESACDHRQRRFVQEEQSEAEVLHVPESDLLCELPHIRSTPRPSLAVAQATHLSVCRMNHFCFDGRPSASICRCERHFRFDGRPSAPICRCERHFRFDGRPSASICRCERHFCGSSGEWGGSCQIAGATSALHPLLHLYSMFLVVVVVVVGAVGGVVGPEGAVQWPFHRPCRSWQRRSQLAVIAGVASCRKNSRRRKYSMSRNQIFSANSPTSDRLLVHR